MSLPPPDRWPPPATGGAEPPTWAPTPGGPPLLVPPPRLVGPGVRTPARRVGRYVRDVLIVLLCSVLSVSSIGAWLQHTGNDWLVALILLAVPLCAAVLWRRRHPERAVLITAIGAVVLPIDPLAALFCLPWVIAGRSTRVAWLLGGLTSVATAASLVRDAALRPDDSLLQTVESATGEAQIMTNGGYFIVGVLLMAVSVGSGLLLRSRKVVRDATEARGQVVQKLAAEQQQVVRLQAEQQRLQADLTTEVSRQEERGMIARELHDTVAHHLSVVSLRAAALEVSGTDEQVQTAARSVRSSAHQALEEMRDLIAALRDARIPIAAGPGGGQSLADVPELVTTARDSGADIAAVVFVNGGQQAPTALNRAVYRIVQEALTNAIRHAPHTRVELDLRAAPGDGVHLRVRNALPQAPTSGPGVGTGLLGLRERVALVGGTVQAGPKDGYWELVAHLPWPASAARTVG